MYHRSENRTENVAMFKIITGQAPPYLIDRFSFYNHAYNTWSGPSTLNIPQPKNESAIRNLLCSGGLELSPKSTTTM